MKILAQYLPLCVLLAGSIVAPVSPLHAQAVTYGGGAVNFGNINVCAPGKTTPAPCSSTLTLTFNVTSAGVLGTPKVLTLGAPDLDFTLAGDTCTGSVSSGTCTVQVKFAPLYPGSRPGAVQLVNGGGSVLATAYIHGIGVGPQVAISGSPASILLTSLDPNILWNSVAVDGGGNIFMSNGGSSNDNPPAAIYELPAGGGALKTVEELTTGAAGIAVDGAGSLYVLDSGGNYPPYSLREFPAGCFSASCETVRATGFRYPEEVAVGVDGTVYVSDFRSGAPGSVVKFPLGCTTFDCATQLGTGLKYPYGVALDAAGNVYVTDLDTSSVYKIPAGGGAQTTVINGGDFFYSIAIDAAGDLLLPDLFSGKLVEHPAVGPNFRTIASAFTEPIAVALDAAGNAFVLQFAQNTVLWEVPRSQLLSHSFATSNVGTPSSDSPAVFIVQNGGNTNLTFSGLTVGPDPSFSEVHGTGPTEDCTSSLSLTPGNACDLNISFSPTFPAQLTAQATLTDNSLNAATATQTIALSGAGIVPGSPIGYPDGFTPASASAFSLNGVAAIASDHLRLTDGGQFEAGGAFYSTRVNVNLFTTEFDFQLTGKNKPLPDADGFAFVLQGNGANAIGSGGGGLGYGPPGPEQAGPVITNSVAIKFDLHSNQGEGTSSTGLYINGALPAQPSVNLLPSGIDLHSGHAFHAVLVYDGTTLTLTLKDQTTNATFTQPFTINIPAIVGGQTAYAGFTGGTGMNTAVQDILDWQFSSASCCTAGMPDFPAGFANTSTLALIGTEAVDNALVMTSDMPQQATGAFQIGAVPINRFSTDFDFQSSDGVGDGFTFAIQAFNGPTELGSSGAGLGYGPGYNANRIANSVAVKFDTHNNAGEGVDSTGVYTDGAPPTVPATDLLPSRVDLRTGHVFHSRISYDGVNLKVSITDLTDYANFTQEYPVNIPAAVGASTGHPGFTAGTGNSYNTLKILDWTMSSF